jgi:hypothetical protein
MQDTESARIGWVQNVGLAQEFDELLSAWDVQEIVELKQLCRIKWRGWDKGVILPNN